MNKNSWTGVQLHCTFCGSNLIEEESEEIEEQYDFDFDSIEDYKKSDAYKKCMHHLNYNDNASHYHCSNNNCYYNFNSSLTLFHPLGSYKSQAGDSWAIGFIK